MLCRGVIATARATGSASGSGAGENAIVGIDLADKKQMVVVTDHDSKVLARKTFRCRAWDLGVALDWAADQGEGERVRRGDGRVRADRSPLAGGGPAR